jgi:hypothetical protein
VFSTVILGEGTNGFLGHTALIVGFAACLFGAFALVAATVLHNPRLLRSVQTYGMFALVGSVLAVVVMEKALITRDWSLAYVQKVGSYDTPALFNFTSLWSALEGSILMWLLILAVYTAVVLRRYRTRMTDPMVAWAMVTMFVVTAFFFFLALGPTDVFRAAGAPDFARCCGGPNPLLQNHVLVLFHPPILYLGYVGFTVPFAFAIAALVTGRVGEGWLVETRRWALFAWGFLTLGIILGGWWSYEVLGWGGVWGWDPVENASLLPVAHRHRLHPLGDGAGASRHAARLEPQPAGGHVRAHHPGHVPHPQRRHQQRARVQRWHHRPVPARFVRRRRGRVVGPHRMARRPAAVTRRASTLRCRARARSWPTTSCSRCSRSSSCWAPCSR